EIGYTRAKYGFDAETCGISVALDEQSADIAQGVDAALEQREGTDSDPYDLQGAGDQGLMFGYACDETPELMPLPITLAHRLAERLAEARRTEMPWLRPDGKAQVTVRYVDDVPTEVVGVVLSTQHAPDITGDQLRHEVIARVARPVLERFGLWRDDITFYINPTGIFVVGGPQGDCGLTGRKII
ncbi:MAG TPA: methionine adenosyltransferase, partial [Miltoncostaeaceae bacterium]|nr:methionine adenosyltransferase [Miltoncostaeaceae bacterium]